MGTSTMDILILYILLIFGYFQQATAIIGYEYGSPSLNTATLSLLDVEEYDIPVNQPQIQKQLLQLSKFESIAVARCKVSIFRHVYHCGMHSHISTITDARADYIPDTIAKQCKQMHQTNTFTINASNTICGLDVNHTTFRPITIAGSTTADGRCSGVPYSDPHGSWDNVDVQEIIAITLNSYYTPINLETNKIHLRSGVACSYSDTTCFDIDERRTFWQTIPTDYYKFSYYYILYERYVNRMLDNIYEKLQIVYSLSTQDITFAFAKIGEEQLYGYILIKTEHLKFLILETNKGDTFVIRHRISVANLNIFAYVNSKFVCVEKHVCIQLNYRDVLKQRCNLEKVLKNTLSIHVVNSPDEFAHQLVKRFISVAVVEVVYIIKCIQVEVKIQHVKEYYSQLFVQKDNEISVLSSRTHILMKTGIQVMCNRIIPPMHFLNEGWYRITAFEYTALPAKVKSLTKFIWHYNDPGALTTSGICSTDDLENIRDQIMFPAEKPGILNTMACAVEGELTVSQGNSLSHLLDEDSIEKTTESAWEKIWEQFIIFSDACAGMIGLYFCIRIIKVIIIVTGCALHGIYGWSMHLIGAVWDSITNLLIHLSHKPKKNQEKPSYEESAIRLTPYENSLANVSTSDETSDTSTADKTSVAIYLRL